MRVHEEQLSLETTDNNRRVWLKVASYRGRLLTRNTGLLACSRHAEQTRSGSGPLCRQMSLLITAVSLRELVNSVSIQFSLFV